MNDKALGGLMLFLATLTFIYYTIWTLLLVRTILQKIMDFHN